MKPLRLASVKKKAKYRNVKTVVDGISFDSKREADRYRYLKLLERKGEIKNLKLQVSFELFPNQRINGRVVERSWYYVADFVYEAGGELVVEDSKGFNKVPAYIAKRKAMLFLHGIQIKEV